MKKLLLSTSAVAAMSMVCAPAFADSLTFWDFAKGKFTEINEVTQIEKTVNVYVTDTVTLDSSAQALVAVNDRIEGDLVTFADVGQIGSDGAPNPEQQPFTTTGGFGGNALVGTGTLFHGNQLAFGIHHTNVILNSVNDDQGLAQVNQDSGNNSDQGNTISAAFVFDAAGVAPTTGLAAGETITNGDVAKAEAYVEQLNEDNTAFDIEAAPNLAAPGIQATINGSIDRDVGVFMVNQNAGNMNSQQNALSAAIGDNTFTALSDAGLHQVNSGNFSYDINTVKAELITASANGDQGLVMVNQSVGNMNNQATVVSVAAIASFVALP